MLFRSIVAPDGSIVTAGHNQRVQSGDPTAHAARTGRHRVQKLSVGAALRQPAFRWLALAFSLNSVASIAVYTHLIAYMQDRGFEATLAAIECGKTIALGSLCRKKGCGFEPSGSVVSHVTGRLVSPAHWEGKDMEFFVCGADGKRRARFRPNDEQGEEIQRGTILLDAEIRGDARAGRVDKLSSIV